LIAEKLNWIRLSKNLRFEKMGIVRKLTLVLLLASGVFAGEYYLQAPRVEHLPRLTRDTWLAAHNAESDELLLLVDAGWGGAADGPCLHFAVYNYQSKQKRKLSISVDMEHYEPNPADSLEIFETDSPEQIQRKTARRELLWRQFHLEQSWKKNLNQIKASLKALSFSRWASKDLYPEVPADSLGLKLDWGMHSFSLKDGEDLMQSLERVCYSKDTLWEAEEGEFVLWEVHGTRKIKNSFFIIGLDGERFYDCCDESELIGISLPAAN
jgi:hypothetical protein